MSVEDISKEYLEKKRELLSLERDIQRLLNQLAAMLCPKGKKECEPGNCAYRISNSCEYLDHIRNLDGH